MGLSDDSIGFIIVSDDTTVEYFDSTKFNATVTEKDGWFHLRIQRLDQQAKDTGQSVVSRAVPAYTFTDSACEDRLRIEYRWTNAVEQAPDSIWVSTNLWILVGVILIAFVISVLFNQRRREAPENYFTDGKL